MPRRRWWALLLVLIGLAALAGTGSAVALENNDEFCDSCHTEPETTYVAQIHEARESESAPTLAAFHAFTTGSFTEQPGTKVARCIDCHSGPHPADRAATLVKAAGDSVEFFLGTADMPARLDEPLPDANCTKCHVDDYDADDSFENHFHTLLRDPDAPTTIRCADCHVAHELATDLDQFTVRSAVIPTCERCHEFMGRGPTNMQQQ